MVMTVGDRSRRDAIYRCLADARRRDVLRYLREADDGTASVDDLTAYVVEQETNSPVPDREKVAVSLYHTHLPMLADEGFVEFDERSGTVRYHPHQALERILGVE